MMAKREPPTSGHQFPPWLLTNRPSKVDDDDLHLPRPCSSAAQGAKRERRQHPLGSCNSWGAKRARTARALDVVFPLPLDGSSLRRHKRTDWSDLPDGPAGLIAERLLADDLADYVRFRAVCTAWRRCAPDPREQSSLDSRFHPRRWIMLGEDDVQPTAPHRRRFMNIATGKCVQVDLPEIQGHCVFQPTAEGLLVLVDERTLVVRLLNPFTRQLTELPSLATLLPRERSKTCYAADLAHGDVSVGAAGLAGEGMVALYVSEESRWRMLVVAKAGGERWMVADCGHGFTSLLSFGGRFYCVSGSDVMTVKISGNQPPCLVVAAQLESHYLPWMDALDLVENGRELMLVHCSPLSSKLYELCRVDLDARKIIPIHGLINGKDVATCSFRASSVSSKKFPSISGPGFELPHKVIEHKIDAYHFSMHGLSPGPWVQIRVSRD